MPDAASAMSLSVGRGAAHAQLVHQYDRRASDRGRHFILRRERKQRQVWRGGLQPRGVQVPVETNGVIVEKNGAHREPADSDRHGP